MGRLSACILGLALFSSPAHACLNDVELPTHEREFRSEYARSRGPTPEPPASPLDYGMLVGNGMILLVGAATVSLIGRRSRA